MADPFADVFAEDFADVAAVGAFGEAIDYQSVVASEPFAESLGGPPAPAVHPIVATPIISHFGRTLVLDLSVAANDARDKDKLARTAKRQSKQICAYKDTIEKLKKDAESSRNLCGTARSGQHMAPRNAFNL